ncbi:MAG: serine/threonine protein kinase [Kiritimatiellia bacterium]|jgi:serine/threonine protein kinase
MPTTHYCPRCLTTFYEEPAVCTNMSCAYHRPKSGWGELLHPGDILDRHYLIDKALAVGGAGLTYLARQLDDHDEPIEPPLAIKVLYAQRDKGNFLRRLSNEAQILQELDHDNIVECRGFVQRAGGAPYLVTLFEHGGSLDQHLQRHGPLDPNVAAGILRQILLALDTAHQRGIVHRDLKPENVLLREAVPRDEIPQVRVADFGIAKVAAIGDKLTRQGAFIGTPEYAAPEQFEGLQPTPATDVFAAGALLWFLLAGVGPVDFSDRMDAMRCHQELLRATPPRLAYTVGTEDERLLLQGIFDGMMHDNAVRRWTIQQVLVALDALVDGTSRQLLNTLDLTDHGEISQHNETWIADDDDEDDDDDDDHGGHVLGAVVGVGGPLLAALVSAPLSILFLIGVAWMTGWLSTNLEPSSAPQLDPVVLQTPPKAGPPIVLANASEPSQVNEREQLTAALQRAVVPLQRTCSLDDALSADIRITPRGRVRDVEFLSQHPDNQRHCLIRELRRLRMARSTPGDVMMRISISFH